jgi:pimeloyl-ACP methyl ester carboxylesterase
MVPVLSQHSDDGRLKWMNRMSLGLIIVLAVLLSTPITYGQSVRPARPSVQAVEGYADFSGLRVWYKDTGGGGIAVVLLHPATGSTASWVFQYPALTAAGYRVIAYDRRGSGRTLADRASDIPPGSDADDLQLLMNYLHIDRFHLVGSAAGAFCAVDYALSYPTRLRSLVIANSIGGVQDATFLDLGRRLRPSPQFDALPIDFKELGPSYRASDPEGTQRWLEIYRASVPAQTFPRLGLKNQITLAALETITAPTLLITGGADLYAPPPIQELFRARIKNSESVVISEAGHSAFWERPEEFNRTVLSFLEKH